ncbi:glycosyltransferase [Staphylococcus kloosii]|uniref:Capsular biosynthesis protein n=1 Tax=Staphylococcus kloosii TaxID=29384 RepID=A0A151A3V3_9STAP|nr:glycosyltransferase [Staphylococcus kloosii]KYH13850.1 capsular biosynthesis protein [Staphylococcus kloosii]
MRILNIVSSNIVQDPRILKQMETIKLITDDYIVLGKSNINVTDERLKKLNFNYKLFGQSKKENSIIKKISNRIKFGRNVIHFIKCYKPDVIHANDFDVLFIVFLSKYTKARVVYDAHEIYSKNAFINKFKILSGIVQFIEKKIIKKIDYFITVSNAAKGYYLSQGYKKEPIVITNAPIKEEFVTQNNNSSFEVVYQGQLVSNRGYEEFLEAGKHIDDEKINLIIRGFGPLEEELRRTKLLDKINNVNIEDPVEMDQLVKSMSTSQLGVVLTKPTSINFEYTVSNKIFECIHAGLPVLLSPVKEHIYLNNKYNFGIVIDEVTPEKIAKEILKLSKDQEQYRKLKINAIKAADELKWQNEELKLIEIYTKKNL